MNINEYIESNRVYRSYDVKREHPELTPRIKCSDGFSMSVQASWAHYCQPRDNKGPYHSFEIGFPSEEEDLIMEYAENREDPTGTVYGYVPVGVVDAVIEKHGGIAESKNIKALKRHFNEVLESALGG